MEKNKLKMLEDIEIRDINDALGYVKFPINDFTMWHPPSDFKDGKGIINTWEDIYKILKVDMNEEISVDFHSSEGWEWDYSSHQLHINLLIGNAGDMYIYNKRSENFPEDEYNDEGIQSGINFHCEHPCYLALIGIDYVSFRRK